MNDVARARAPLRVAGILPARLRGIGILPMIHGLEAHATQGQDGLVTQEPASKPWAPTPATEKEMEI